MSTDNQSQITGPKRGRPFGSGLLYTEELAAEIIHQLSDGVPLVKICKAPGMPKPRTVRDWKAQNPSLAAALTQARKEGADTLAEEIIAISDEEPREIVDEKGNSRIDPGDVANRKLRAESRKWLASVLNPAAYGAQAGSVQVNVGVQVNNLSEGARERIMELRRARVEEQG